MMHLWDHLEAFQEHQLLLHQELQDSNKWDHHSMDQELQDNSKCDHHRMAQELQDNSIGGLISDHQEMDQWDLLLVVQEVQISDKIYLNIKNFNLDAVN